MSLGMRRNCLGRYFDSCFLRLLVPCFQVLWGFCLALNTLSMCEGWSFQCLLHIHSSDGTCDNHRHFKCYHLLHFKIGVTFSWCSLLQSLRHWTDCSVKLSSLDRNTLHTVRDWHVFSPPFCIYVNLL